MQLDLFEKYKTASLLTTKAVRKIDYSYQELGCELEEYFGKSTRIWAMFHKVGYTEHIIRFAFKETKKKEIKNLNYMIAIIKNNIK